MASKLSWRVIIEAPLRLFVWWLLMVLLVTWRGYPGVVCVTPMAWLLALPVGIVAVQRSTSALAGQRLREAALAGGVLGLLQGALFAALVLRVGEILPGERLGAAVLIGLVVVLGVPVGAGLALLTAWQIERRQRAEP